MSSDYKRRRLETIPTAAGGEEVDRISDLPEEIIHKILALLNSTKEPAKASVLSSTWAKLWRSYPILEFRDTQFGSRQSAERFAAAVAKKFSLSTNGNSTAIEAVRVKLSEPPEDCDPQFCSAFLDQILEPAAKRSQLPQEIDITGKFDDSIERCLNFGFPGTYAIPPGLLLPESSSGRHLKVLKLVHCNFDQYRDTIDVVVNNNPFTGLGSSLRQLSLTRVSFPDGDGGRILNSILAGASCLQNLYLSGIVGIRRLQVRNLPNLKRLTFRDCPVEDVEITGVQSLESLDISNAPMGGDFVVSSMPHLKTLSISASSELTEQKFDNLITKAPLLESLYLGFLAKVRNLKIVSMDKLREIYLSPCNWNELQVIAMDAPKLQYLCYRGRIDGLLAMLGKIGSYHGEEVGGYLDVQYYSRFIDENNLHTLRKFIAQLTQIWFRLTLNFDFSNIYESYKSDWKEVEEKLPIPRIDHVNISWNISKSFDKDAFFNGLFQNFHPTYLSFTQQRYSCSMPDKHVLAPEYICKQLLERDTSNHCEIEDKCWYHQFKDMKIIKRVRAGEIKVEEGDEVMDISTEICSSLA